MPAEAREQVLGALNRFEQVDLTDRATAAPRLVAVDGEQQAWHTIRVHETAGHDALHAFMPTFARHHKRALTVVDRKRRVTRDLRKLGLDGAAFVVGSFELGGELARRVEIVGHEQVERYLGIAQTPSSVQPRNQREAQVGRGHGLARSAGLAEKRRDARARIVVDTRQAVSHERAVLVAHGHQVGNRAKRCQVGVVAPQVREPEAPAERLDYLKCNAHAGKNRTRAIGVGFRIDDRYANGLQLPHLVVVRDDDFDAFCRDGSHFVLASDAAVDRHDNLRIELLHALASRRRQCIALVEATRDERRCVTAQGAQPAREHCRGRHAVNVEVAEHDDMAAVANSLLEMVNHLADSRHVVRFKPVAIEARVEETLCLLDRRDATRRHDGRHEFGQIEMLPQ